MRRTLALLVAALAFALTLGSVPAGAQQVAPVEITGIDLSEFPDVTLRIAADAAAAQAINERGLQVTENGQVLESSLTALSNEVIGVVLVVDTSGSMAEALAQAKGAADQLVASLPADARVAVVNFGSTAQLVSTFTTDRDVTLNALLGLDAEGGTAMFDAVALAAQQAGASDADRTAVVLLTDGADSDSTSTDLASAGTALSRSVDDFYAVSLQTPETDNAGLAALADAAPSGRVVQASDPDALAAAYVGLGQRIVNQYQVTFVSTTPDPTGTFVVGVPDTELAGAVEIALPDRPTATSVPTTDPTSDRPLPGALVVEANPSPLAQTWALYAGAALVALAVIYLVYMAVSAGASTRPRRRSLRGDSEAVEEVTAVEGAVEALRSGATQFTSRMVERADASRSIDAALDRAGLVMRAGEFVSAVVALAVVLGSMLYLLMGVAFGVVGFLLPLFGAKAFLDFLAGRRNRKFADQLGDTLLIMAGALRSGFGVGQAIDTVAEEMDPPIASEFQRALLETRLGRDMDDALAAIADRVDNEDFGWVVDAMRINKQVGGELATILDQVAATIRARNRLKRQVAALTAEGRMSAYVLSVLPIGIGFILFSSNPDYMKPLWDTGVGNVMFGASAGLLLAGVLWLRKMINIEY